MGTDRGSGLSGFGDRIRGSSKNGKRRTESDEKSGECEFLCELVEYCDTDEGYLEGCNV